ncbi:MAG: hypothetical protein A2V66_12025 [Ignavibacteria bacterium RBG_13_36_8]|nr:MAG: hypothetical protein A2V66_12025 [Ignavibacteria bacterium RBG_13_36_8]
MLIRKERLHYKRNFELGLILSLTLTILVILIYPYPSDEIEDTQIFFEPVITVIDIPQTEQDSPPQMSAQLQPKPLVPSLLVEIDEPQILEDIELEDNTLKSSENVGMGIVDAMGGTGTRVLSSLPFVPRQLLEVVPPKDDYEGSITLSLRIGKDGMVKEYRVLKNTTRSSECLQNVLTAVCKSKWVPVQMEGERVEFWIEKSYRFD